MKAIELVGITKTFGSVHANDDVTLDVEKGEILSLLGENGSGKTTLMNMLAGIYFPDAGHIFIDGKEVLIKSPIDAFKHKIGMVHQHFKLVDLFTAADNIILGEKMPRFSIKEKSQQYKHQAANEISALDANLDEKAKKKAIAKINNKRNLKICALPFIKFVKAVAFNYLPRNRAKKLQKIADQYGFDIDLKKKIYEMSVSEKQTVEIIKVLYRGADKLILDEPTAVLTPQEIQKLFAVMRKMRESGKSIIIITHKLNEVMEISDRVAVLRKGKYIGTVKTSETSEKELTEMMVGAKVDLNIDRQLPVDPQPRLVVEGLTVRNKDGLHAIEDVSFTVNGGEILGIAGISGNGQKELLEGIAGLQHVESGNIIFYNPKENKPVTFFHNDLKQVKKKAEIGMFHYPDGTPVDLKGKSNKEITKLVNDEQILYYENEVIDLKHRTPREIQELGIKLSFVPEDRLNMGLVGNMSIVDNMMLRSYRKGKSVFVNRKRPKALADKIIDDLGVVTPSDMTPVRRLSGGNVQKVLVGREISSSPKVLMSAYPVRGLDVNSSYLIYNLLNEQKARNTAVVYVGEDLDVLIALCDRILVLCGGKVSAIVDARKVTKEQLGLLMTKMPETVERYEYAIPKDTKTETVETNTEAEVKEEESNDKQ
ncbi:MAG: ABC transporter ATP-binding protein [Clostridia bacterium]|nr:ABC transporter ATP-binding protein [Clostridia bacterium]